MGPGLDFSTHCGTPLMGSVALGLCWPADTSWAWKALWRLLGPPSFSFHRCHSQQTACPRACLSICSLENPGSCCSASRSSPSQASVYSSLNWANHFTYKGPSSQSYGFPSSHVRMWELDHKEDWVLKNWCFQTVVLEKILETLGQQGDQTSQS